jgi:N-methylhydantoinase A
VTLNFAGQKIDSGPRRKGLRKVYFPDSGFVDCPVYNRYALMPGTSLHGPAIIEERESTVVAGADARIFVDDHLNVVIDIDSLAAPPKATP